MTKIIKYVCNLCKQERISNDLQGIYFTSGDSFDFKDANCCETHVCKVCLNVIYEKLGPKFDSKLCKAPAPRPAQADDF
jgi:hypothetical protein